MPIQTDLPDFSSPRQVTDDPIININQAVNVTPYDSGVLDVAQFSHLHVAALANNPTAVFTLKIIFHPTAAGSTNVFVDTVILQNQGAWYNADYPMATRYVHFQVSEVTATGGNVILQVSPASGPSTLFTFAQPSPVPVNGTIGAGATLTYDPQINFRGLWRYYVMSRTPIWSFSVIALDSGGAGTTLLILNNGFTNLPLDLTMRLETARLTLSFTNGWVNPVRVYLFMTPIAL